MYICVCFIRNVPNIQQKVPGDIKLAFCVLAQAADFMLIEKFI